MDNLSYNGSPITQREIDGYVNATEMAKANNKEISHWFGTEDFNRYADAISQKTGIPRNSLVIRVSEGFPAKKKTWVHPKLAIKLARWISVEFELWCDEHIKTLLETGQTSQSSTTGPANLVWFERLLLFKKKTQIPHGYFSIFGELTHTLISDFETAGYVLPDHSVIDISVGKCWSNFLKKSSVNISGLRMEYLHYYPDGRIVTAFIYKNELLSLFRDWVEMTYKSGSLVKYLSNRDPKALTTLYQMLGLPEG